MSHVNPVDRWGGTPLDDAVQEGHDSIVALLRSAGDQLGPGRRRSKLQRDPGVTSSAGKPIAPKDGVGETSGFERTNSR